jgi:hypothetical protein
MLRYLISAALIGAALCSATGSASADILRVPQDYPTIQSAIDAAPQGATVVVAAGTYRENLLILKPITLRSVRGARDTVIDGRRVGPVVVVRGTGAERVVIAGFTITNGLNNGSVSSDAAGNAAGIHMESVVGVVMDSVIRDNVGCLGSGISTVSAAVTIERNLIRNNPQDPSCDGADGGGIFLRVDGVRPSKVANNVVVGHRTGGRGAGVAVQEMAGLTILDNVINGNDASSPGGGAGGGIFINVASGTISGNVLIGNSAQSGGAMALFPIDNANRLIVHGNVMASNRATSAGSAIYLVTFSDEALRLTGNLADGNTETALIYCDGTTFTVPASNILHNGQGPELGGNCVSP